MSVQNPDEGNPTPPAGGAEQPTSQPSGGASQPLPEYVKTLQGQLAELRALVKGVQKGTDKQIGQVRNEIDRILELKDNGKSKEEIIRELSIDRLLGQIAPVPQADGSAKPDNSLDVEAALNDLEFDPNDVALAALKQAYGSNPGKLLTEAIRLRKQQTSPPRPGSQPAPSGGISAVPQGRIEEIASAMEKELDKVPRGSAGIYARSQIKAKYREQARKAGFNLNV